MEIRDVALVLRKTEEGKIIIFGTGLSVPNEIIDDRDYLVLGHINIYDKYLFSGYEIAPGSSPDNMLMNGGLEYKNYKSRLK